MIEDELKATTLFGRASEESRALAATAVAEDVPAGQVLAQAGDHGSGMYVVLAGTVSVELRGGHHVEIGPGGFFGELALLVPDAERIARVRAATDARLLCVPRQMFERLLDTEPTFSAALLRELATRFVARG